MQCSPQGMNVERKYVVLVRALLPKCVDALRTQMRIKLCFIRIEPRSKAYEGGRKESPQ